MTFGQTRMGQSVARTGVFLRKQLWIWPIVAVVVLAIVGYGVNSAIKQTMEANLKSELQTLLDIEASMVKKWMQIQEGNAQTLANDQGVRTLSEQLVAASGSTAAENNAEGESAADLRKLRAQLDQEIGAGLSPQGFVGYVLSNKEQKVIASSNVELIGLSVPDSFERTVARALEGNATVSTPHSSGVMMKDARGRLRTGVPSMFACVPVRDQSFQVIAVLAMRIRPEREFTQILQMGRIGSSGETYAFNADGLLVSNSRFDDQLILLGILPDTEDAQSILTVSLRDPQGNMQSGFRPRVRRSELPLTRMATSAISGLSEIDLVGYRDYRGVPVVGAWTWLSQYDMGLATEIDYAEAFRPLAILRWTFFSMFGLLILSSIAIFVFTLSVSRLQREAQKAAIEAKQLGQYHLDNRIGAGAMGVVYKGHHAMLRRPTAIKLLNIENLNEAAIARFEREVQITCKLTHPSTIAIYDYGRTPEGVFYYAMEYLDGIDLQTLVERYGPQPEARVIHILRQMCGSLYEAHSLGLVHRDIKPANVMLNRRGGEPDIVKVLDFGLVKSINDQSGEGAGGISGTPLYMSPEAIQSPDSVDSRSDLYAMGAVGYYLLTGQPVFSTTSLAELCQMHVTAVPVTPSERLGTTVSAELENALMACLEKNRAKRPQTARDLMALMTRAATAHAWSINDAEAWWGRHERAQPGGSTNAPATFVTSSGTNLVSSRQESARKPTSPQLPGASVLDRTMIGDAGEIDEG